MITIRHGMETLTKNMDNAANIDKDVLDILGAPENCELNINGTRYPLGTCIPLTAGSEVLIIGKAVTKGT